MGVDAREVVRYAKRIGCSLSRYSDVRNCDHFCAVRCLFHMANKNWKKHRYEDLRKHFGINAEDFRAIEHGFEDWDFLPKYVNNPYYKVGQNIARLAGLL